jgi:hypothetical protein
MANLDRAAQPLATAGQIPLAKSARKIDNGQLHQRANVALLCGLRQHRQAIFNTLLGEELTGLFDG